MAKRQAKQKDTDFDRVRKQWQRILWAIVIIICILFGYSYGYPVVAAGETGRGILVGLAYGGGAFIAVSVSYFLNQKLKGK
ncbi:MAG: hypothetical protein D6784_11240 [Chloroflexi bacterium]|nr:MAG: hypothetical protein D6784_11240 [Chloroflexota bacterium]